MTLLERLLTRWTAPGRALALGASRAAFYSWLLLILRDRYFYSQWALERPPEMWLPVWFLSAWPAPPLGPQASATLGAAWTAATALAALGLWTRGSALLSGLLLFVLDGLSLSYGYPRYAVKALVVVGLILPWTRCGDAVSLDSWLARRRGRAPPASGRAYGWPLRLARLVFVCFFLGAGLSKLRFGGVRWIAGDTLRNLLLSADLLRRDRHTLLGSGDWDIRLARSPACRPAAAAVVALEIAAPAALIFPRARPLLLPALAALPAVFLALMRVNFISWYALFAFWIPWDRLAAVAKGDEAALGGRAGHLDRPAS